MKSWIVLFALHLSVLLVSADNLALLSGTLRTYQRAGCDDEFLTLKCPTGTRISIEVAQYGKASSKPLCNPKNAHPVSKLYNTNASCLWSNSLQTKWEKVGQGNWGRTVIEACQKKQQCKFLASPKTFGGDPCPGDRKYVEVAYKCRPYEFRSKEACENKKIELKCNPNSRVAVYSASYGRTEHENLYCPQPQGVSEETCLVSYATETVMQICHGKRSCELTADASTFGRPCRPNSRMYLKVVYACVPRVVLKEQYKGRLEPDEMKADHDINDDVEDYTSYDSGKEFISEFAALPPTPNVQDQSKDDNLAKDSYATSSKIPPHTKSGDIGAATFKPHTTSRTRTHPSRPSYNSPVQKNTKDMQADIPDPNCTVTIYAAEENKVIGFISQWINTYTFVSQNQERFYLYLILSVAAGVVLCLSLLVGRLLVQRHRARRDAKFQATTVGDDSLPNGFADDISEVDADINLTTPLPVPVPVPALIHSGTPVGSIAEVVRYPHVHAHTLRRDADSDVPRSLNTGFSNHYYG